MVAGAGLSSSSFHLLHLRPSSTFRSLNLLVSRKPPLILSSSWRAAARAHSLAGNFEWHGSAPRSKRGSDGFWEDPDDGYDSELEEVNQEVEDEEGEEVSGDEGDARISTVSQYDDLVKEVDLILEPEEKVILQQNEVPDLSKLSTMKWNPFHSLALSGQIPFMDRLLEDGSTEIDCLDKDGFTALHKAIIGKKEAVISHLLRRGANPQAKDLDGATPLHYAAQVGAMQTVKLLIKYKVDVNVADNDGWTPLHVAIQTRSRDIAKVLLVNGADKMRRNKDGKTPLDLSLCFGKDFKSYELAKLLKLVPANRNF
ncbi:hypothetical protein OPV22_026518 [Ensete ventricosum]|uniref:Ankyrin repeat domain-containing protein EMB506, chloroplastic n=1 Tax=Ensete ventricosum TaxID=4639 RepID=A0AAV8QK79_ENSVE|nr:hypothetical protein OPV22_026518 [Ensete ventricosum]